MATTGINPVSTTDANPTQLLISTETGTGRNVYIHNVSASEMYFSVKLPYQWNYLPANYSVGPFPLPAGAINVFFMRKTGTDVTAYAYSD